MNTVTITLTPILRYFIVDNKKIIASFTTEDNSYSRPIAGYSNNYLVDKWRKVYSTKTNKYLKTSINKSGYEKISINENSKITNLYIHRLVALAFIPNPDNLPEVVHKDRNRANNHVNNLRWLSVKQNRLNRGSYKKSKSIFPGVSWSQIAKKMESSNNYQ